ncbi:MAG: B12-binding domain-containing radical SAM protein [Alphaproteobacteria bacterium]|nr:B12-binding domain-containing radical SAM protein [Alphaproteobacteria bacterium]
MKVAFLGLGPSNVECYGIRILSSCVRQRGHETVVYFVHVQPGRSLAPEQVINLSQELARFDVIGLSVMSPFLNAAIDITQQLKSMYSKPIVWGGIHPTVDPKGSLAFADIVSVGESENSFPELLEKLERKEDWSQTRGIHFMRDGKYVDNGASPLVQDLDTLPFADIDWRRFFLVDDATIIPFTEKLYEVKSGKTYGTFPTRGCPYKCSYCTNSFLNSLYPGQKPVRKRSAENVIQELEVMTRALPFMHAIKFDDDAFFVQKDDEIERFAEIYKARVGMRIFVCGATPATLSKRKLDALVGCNIITIRMGIQSFSNNARKIYNRPHTSQRILSAANLLAQYADRFVLPPRYDIILDNPWETEEDVVETIKCLAQIKPPYKLSVFSLRIFPGTDLYDDAVREGLLPADLDLAAQWGDYHKLQETYVNQLVYTLSWVARFGFVIPTWYVNLMCSKFVRSASPWLGQALIKIIYWACALYRFGGSARVHFNEALGDLRKGETGRIRRFIWRFFVKS